ncbi:maleylpyruvate isomerase family mycothiol-dependent enzyme [Streptomyces sp. AJS327]|uniref:maleylpyruvate isomerase family mycothiol-dependent enzyme n=1 Tax=Streptomyces sp. AJS327 TaxID=2545265 RepID=UPI0015E025EF|nr:maleylpyruvate isomerase family mycothiol-dependent enzyme [Streptomyces sp. AJS327]MBA0052798.1 maleylpyruvate isomerase family mycothiol-dependent enzyme [Streptomyces sp. AJS327]
MTDHPSLQSHVDAWTQSIEAISELVTSLTEGEWNRATACPGWSVRDVVSHIIGIECELLGDPRPIHTLPRDLYHIKDETSRHMEVQVDVRRHHTGAEMTSELEYTIIRRSRQLRNDKREPDSVVPHVLPGAEDITLDELLQVRVFDVWVHEQDIRRALGVPGNLDSAGAQVTRDFLTRMLPYVVAKRAGGAPKSSVVFDIGGGEGELEFMRTVRVDENGRGTVDGSPSLGPTVSLSMGWETYLRLACGRVRPDAVADAVKVEGDRDFAQAILNQLATIP